MANAMQRFPATSRQICIQTTASTSLLILKGVISKLTLLPSYNWVHIAKCMITSDWTEQDKGHRFCSTFILTFGSPSAVRLYTSIQQMTTKQGLSGACNLAKLYQQKYQLRLKLTPKDIHNTYEMEKWWQFPRTRSTPHDTLPIATSLTPEIHDQFPCLLFWMGA